MIINHNISAIHSHRQLKWNDYEMMRDIEKLSSGMRINRAGDDAAGLAVSEKMRTQVHGLRQAERNAEDGISFIQTTEGYLSETQNMLQRIRVLAVQSANGIYTAEDRQQIQVEISQLIDEIDRIASQAEFNKMKMLTGGFARLNPTASMWFHIGANMHQRERVYVNTMTTAALGLRNPTVLTFISISTPDKANSVIGLADDA
ncbi:MAG: flagellin, partial [Leptospirales bacterium]